MLVALANVEAEFSLTIKVWALLNKPPYSMNISKFMYEYQMKYNNCISMSLLGKMKLAVTVSSNLSCLRFLRDFLFACVDICNELLKYSV